MAADFTAIDRGEGRTVACLYRGSSSAYARRFRRKMLDLAPDALVFRPFWSSPDRSAFRVARGDVVSALPARPDRATAFYAPGSAFFGYASFDVIACETAEGALDLAVPRPDVPLVLYYLHSGSARPAEGTT